MTNFVEIKRIDPDLELPQRAHENDGAVDLRSTINFSLDSLERKLIPTGISVAIPAGFAGLIIPRSGLANKFGVSIVNAPGLIDAGYRGEIGVVLINLSKEPVSFERGDRIAQLAITPVSLMPFFEVSELVDSKRSSGGFGSSGVK